MLSPWRSDAREERGRWESFVWPAACVLLLKYVSSKEGNALRKFTGIFELELFEKLNDYGNR